ncbi:hypothetical protein LguiB_004886 [Lonicera macranthoides]
MPLVRVEVRNEYGLGLPELYKDVNKEDPKAVLDGVAVAGLVGILRQLGDLAEFAAEVFHGLQEQVMSTSSRSHKLMARVKNIEVALPPIEKAILAQRNHLHFAYTTGSHWHVRVRSEQNHFIYSDLPRFIMDSYEECRGPPRLHLLDKFDTNGPGSCLKRYSDPTFFRRTSAGSYDVNVEKVLRDKKARRRKKKRKSLRNGEVQHGAPISSRSGRTQFTSPHFDGQISPPQSVSTSDVAFKSEMGDQSNSFDSRTGSGYIECVFRPNYTAHSEEHEPKESSSPQFNMHRKHTIDSSSINEQSSIMDEDIHNSLSQDQTAPSSSCVTWDEKMEIMDRTGQEYDHDEITDTFITNFDLGTQEGGDVNFITVDHMDFHFENENMTTSVSGGNQLDDIESETDNYMDALNTIESESETDFDCQTKREVEQVSGFNNKEIEDELHELPHHSEIHLLEFESDIKPDSVSPESQSAANISSDNSASGVKPDSFSSDFYAHVQLPQLEGPSLIHEFCGNADIGNGSNLETVVSKVSSPGVKEPDLPIPESDKIISSPCESQNSPIVPSGVPPVMFWTNGGLLGLEPSKPPDFTGLNGVSQSKDETGPHSSLTNIQEGEGPRSKCSTSGHIDLEDDVSVKMQADLGFKLDQSSIHYNSSFDQAHRQGFSETSMNVQTTKAGKEDGNSSRMFEFGNRLLVNGFRRQMSLDEDSHQTFPRKTFKDKFGNGSPFVSPSSSPPLEHMKISFQPSFDTSKLKLKLPDGSNCHESSGDMFPSFQLVPEPSVSLHGVGSDSDDDTFDRSSPYMSDDDCLSENSESNSEQWESRESPKTKDHELYDALYRISTTESVSSPQIPFIEDGGEFSHSGHFDLPSFDSLKSSFKQDLVVDSDASKETTPPPPPLPPLEWRGIKPHPDVATEKQESLSEALNYTFDSKLLVSTISQQPKPAPVKYDQNIEAIACPPKSEQPDCQKLNEQKEGNQTANGKVMDEKEDFLHQIRAKSFNLRRTATARPTVTAGAPASVKVTAILEKASAIRQAVGSDDGEDDDNWSDT